MVEVCPKIAHNEQGLAKWLRLCTTASTPYLSLAIATVQNIDDAGIVPNAVLYDAIRVLKLFVK
jgi:hypothetical protein